MNDLVKSDPKPGEIIVADQVHSDDDFAGISSSGKWLGRIMLYGGGSNDAKEGKINIGHFGLVSGKVLVDLSKEFDALPIVWRPKAMDIGGENIINVHDKDSVEFKRIVAQSEVKDSGCMFGPEFLVWIPSVHKFASYFASSKTARRAAPALRELLRKPATFKSEFIKTKQYSWHGPAFLPCSTPFDLPDDVDLAEEVEKFNNPPADTVERVAPAANTGRAR